MEIYPNCIFLLFTVTNTRFSDWINTGSPRNGIETQSSACPNRAKSAQCVGANDNKSIRELNLIDTTCSSNGFSCTDAAQKKHDPNNPNVCPDFKARFECPHTDSKSFSNLVFKYTRILSPLKAVLRN